jgi:proline dehydrogenase
MLSYTLNRAARSGRARRVVERIPVTRRVVERFVAGETVSEAVNTTASLRAGGRLVTLDVLGEDVVDRAGAEATVAAYVDLLLLLAETGCADGNDVSVKLTALGQSLPGLGQTWALDHARTVCEAAARVGCTVTLDMEDHTTVDSTLAIGDALRRDFPKTGVVLQSNLRRTAGDLRDLVDGAVRVRLVKGAYREPVSVAFQRKREVDEAYLADLRVLFSSACYPMVATHDPNMVSVARSMAAANNLPSDAWETQMLFGIRADLQESVVRIGEQLRVYVPFGSDWYGYFMRRLAERPANVAFFLRALRHR